MSRNRRVAVMAVLVAALAIAVNVVPSAAQEAPPPIAAEPLTPRSIFPDQVDLKFKVKHGKATMVVNQGAPSHTVVVRYTVQPGARFPWHSHAGPVVVNIVSGSLTYIPADTCIGQTYFAGQAFLDAGHGHVHSAVNSGMTPTVFVATFFGAPAQGPLLIPADPAC